MAPDNHITICVCTFKRPRLLTDLLQRLGSQQTNQEFALSIVVVDNDFAQSARSVVDSLQRQLPVPVQYHVEPEQNISLARNRAVAAAEGNLAAFIDDDEIPPNDWLLRLWTEFKRVGSDGILGPVNPTYEVPPPQWVLKSRLFERPSHPSEYELLWFECRTGNALVKRSVLKEVEGPFRPECGSGGEDRDFFRRAIERGRRFTWCPEAAVHELVPAHRMRRSFQLRRALLRGKASLAQSTFSGPDVLKSLVASLAYTVSLPVLLLFGQHVFMKYLIRNCDHLGKLLACLGIDVVRDPYITE